MSTPGPAPDVFAYPESRTGKVAVGLIAAALGTSGFVAAIALLAEGMAASNTIVHGAWVTIPLVAMALCGTCAAISAIVACVVEHERSIFVALALLVGIILTYFSINGF